MAFQIRLAYSSGFSRTLVHWRATLRVGARGEVEWSCFDRAPLEAKETRVAFDLNEDLFQAIGEALRALPATIGGGMDDAPTQLIAWSTPTEQRTSERVIWRRKPAPHEHAFRELWATLYALVRPALVNADAPAAVLEESDASL